MGFEAKTINKLQREKTESKRKKKKKKKRETKKLNAAKTPAIIASV